MESFLTYGECTDQCLSSVSFAVDDVVFKWLLLLRKCNAAVHYIENRMHQKQACMKIKLQRKESHSHFSTLPPPPSTTVYHLGIRVCISAFYNSGGCLKIGSLLQFSLPQCCVANSHSIHYIQQETRKLNVIMGFPWQRSDYVLNHGRCYRKRMSNHRMLFWPFYDNSSKDNSSNDNLSNDSSSKQKFNERQFIERQFIEPIVHRTDSSSNRQFIEPTVYRNDSLSNRQFIESTVHQTDSLSNRQFIEWQFIQSTVHQTDSLSNRQFIEPTVHRTTVYRTDSLSNWQFIEKTVHRTDNLSNDS